MNSVSIRGDGAALQLAVAGYEREAVQDATDADWLRAHVQISVPGFAASLELALLAEEVTRTLGELSSVLARGEGAAEFNTLEDCLRLTIALERTGRGVVSGIARHLDRPTNQLSFAFDTDRTFLDRAERDLRSISNAFPSRGQE